jgi:hypothetical protein
MHRGAEASRLANGARCVLGGHFRRASASPSASIDEFDRFTECVNIRDNVTTPNLQAEDLCIPPPRRRCNPAVDPAPLLNSGDRFVG